MRHALLLLLLVGCGGIAFEDYEGETRDARCEYEVRCKGVSNAADCQAQLDAVAIDSPSLPAAVRDGIVTYDEDAAQRCVDALASLTCDTTQQGNALASCDDVYAGTLDDGEACGFDLECKSDNCATSSCPDACCPGTCRTAARLPDIDQPCSTICVDGAYCGSDALCHAYLPAGAACDGLTICAPELYCAGSSQGGSGMCTAIPHVGQACDGPCAEYGTTCLAGTCTAVGLAGDACESDAECSPFYSCNSDQRCGTYPAVGMACTSRCSDDAYCDNRVCLATMPNGAGCINNLECTSNFCDKNHDCSDPPLCI